MSEDLEVPFLDFREPGFSTRSAEVLDARDKGWLARTPFGLAILRHREVGLLLRHKKLRQGSYAWPNKIGLAGSFADFWKRSVISTEGETHRKLRDLAKAALTPEYIESLKPEFDRISQNLVSGLSNSDHCEFMTEFANPFAGQAICTLLGADLEKWQAISSDACDLGLAMGLDGKSHEATFNVACDRLMSLATELIRRAQKGLDGTSYVARLVSIAKSMGNVSEQELHDMVVISIFGGVDTTRSQLGFAIALLVEHPQQWQALRENVELVPQAIEESIRARPTTTWATREALEEFEFQGHTFRKGETLHMLVHSSARDPAICDDPTFDITKRRKIHFGFGGGAHNCLGSMVARSDMASALASIVKAIEHFEFAGTPEWLPDSGNTSPISIPLKYKLA